VQNRFVSKVWQHFDVLVPAAFCISFYHKLLAKQVKLIP
jgi:hypothetical protein